MAGLTTDRSKHESLNGDANSSKTDSAGVEKSALSLPAESWTETVTRSAPLPPLPKLLVWKLPIRCQKVFGGIKRRELT